MSLAGRYDDYSDFGDTTNPKVAVRWSPIDSLAFRASWGTGFRAPSLAQIGLGPSQESQFFKDTFGCADHGISGSALRSRSTTRRLLRVIRISQPEDSETFNVGAAWQPSAMWRVSVDYWDIMQEDKIDTPFGFVYTHNCNDQASTVCRARDAGRWRHAGPTQSKLRTVFTNIGEQSVTGIDLGASFATDLGAGCVDPRSRVFASARVRAGRANFAGTGFVTRDLTGEYEYPEDRFVLTGDWAMDAWDFYAAVNYIGSFEDAPD